jgi:hypothetical protein
VQSITKFYPALRLLVLAFVLALSLRAVAGPGETTANDSYNANTLIASVSFNSGSSSDGQTAISTGYAPRGVIGLATALDLSASSGDDDAYLLSEDKHRKKHVRVPEGGSGFFYLVLAGVVISAAMLVACSRTRRSQIDSTVVSPRT